jgi:ABC-2 type transport system ATP-binding protein
MHAVSVSSLTKRYGGRAAVDGLSFRVERGEIFALLGPNGAGKTTTVEILEGYRKPDGGEVRVLGLDPIAQGTALRPRIGVMLQEGGAPPGLRAREALELFAAMYSDPEPVDALLDRVGLAASRRTLVRDLSGGQRQRLSLAMAIVGKPEMVFLDEPTAGMDAAARRATWEMIRGFARSSVTVLLTTHYLEEAERLADRVAIIDRGVLLAMDRPEALTSNGHGMEISFSTAAPISEDELRAALGCDVHDAGAGYRLAAAPSPRLIAKLAAWLADRDVILTELHAGRTSLEDVFIRLTGSEGGRGPENGDPRSGDGRGGPREPGQGAGG